MSAPSVSVIVVSRGRAADLPLCLLGISQLGYPAFEVVLVADADGIDAARALPFFDDLKVVPFDEANISSARNLGIAEAAGEIVAFIDDDAVPEPTWLRYLVAGFNEPEVAASGGFVIGRNGISFQWKARSVDCTGTALPMDVDAERISVLTPQNGRAIKTEGTNMALRRDVIVKMGGFDSAFRFFLDETDVNFRLMRAGHKTAIAPLAQVHHGYKASATRRGDRVPTDLTEIGASLAVYLRKHAPGAIHEPVFARMRHEQRVRALRHMVSGLIEPRDVRRLLGSFDQGVAEGRVRALVHTVEIPRARSGFRAMARRYAGPHVVLSGRAGERSALMTKAAAAVKQGNRVSLFLFSRGMRPHRVRFTKEGVWLQRGGTLGRSLRSDSRISLNSSLKKLTLELKRLAKIRDFPPKEIN